jgi:hypothetical protein
VSIQDGFPVNASYTNSRLMSKQADNAIDGFVQTGKWVGARVQDIATAASINDLAVTSGFVRMTGSTATALDGIANGANGFVLTIVNASSAIMTVAHESGPTPAANRIITPSGSPIQVLPNRSILLQYDSTASRWRVLGGSALNASQSTQGQASLLGSQTNTNVSGLSFSASGQFTAFISYNVQRGTSIEAGMFIAKFNGTNWSSSKAWYIGNADVDFNVSGGQVRYTTDGATGGIMLWSFHILEV